MIYRGQKFQDAMMACHLVRNPDLFVSFMCNTVDEGDAKKQSPVFQDNLKKLMKHQKTRLHRGEIDASNIPISFQHVTNYLFTCQLTDVISNVDICMIEFQKKGLPHAHILQFLGTCYKKRHEP